MVQIQVAALSLLVLGVSAAHDSQSSSTASVKPCSTKSTSASHGSIPSSIISSIASISPRPSGSVGSTLTINTKNASGSSGSVTVSSPSRASSSRSSSKRVTPSSNTAPTAPSRSVSRSSAASSASSQTAGDACPTYTNLPTYTYTVTSTYIPTWVNPTTTTTWTLTTTPLVTVPTVTTVTAVYGPSVSTYTFAADTRVTLTIAPAATTVSAANPDGFVPVRCQSDFFQSTTTISVEGTQTFPGDVATEVVWITATTQDTVYTYTATSTASEYVTTSFESNVFPPVVTVATTRTQSTSTVYEACATNNVTPDFPGGNYTGSIASQNNPQNGSTGPFNLGGTQLLAADATDCCQLCQATANCTGSAYRPFRTDETRVDFYDRFNCFLATRDGATEEACSASDPAQVATAPTSAPVYYLSNGPCGKWNFDRQFAVSIPF